MGYKSTGYRNMSFQKPTNYRVTAEEPQVLDAIPGTEELSVRRCKQETRKERTFFSTPGD